MDNTDLLIYHTPSDEWIEGLPIGNGKTGLMAYGLPAHEKFSFNADTLYRSNIKKRIISADIISKLSTLVMEGNGVKADQLFSEHTSGQPESCNPYQPFMNICADVYGSNTVNEYTRMIDLKNGLVKISYSTDINNVCWTMFASYPNQLLILKRVSTCSENVSLSISREYDPDCTYSVTWNGSEAYFNGRFSEGAGFRALAGIQTDGNITASNGTFNISECRSIELRIAMETDFENNCTDIWNLLNSASKLNFDELLKLHTDDYSKLYNRMSLKLESDSRTTEQLYAEAVDNGIITPRLCAQLFAYARYLTISSSREGSLPINLQGLWNVDLHPEWDCGYTVDMNLQMAYWMTESANLSECHMPLFDWIDSRLDVMEQQCRDIFGAENGAYIPQYTDAFMTPTCWNPYGAFQVLWSGAAPWLASHYYKHWLYTNDDEFAEKRAFPFMKRCMNLYMHLFRKDSSGRLILPLSTNPENWAADGGMLINTSTMDISLVNELLRNLLYMNEVLCLNDPMAEQWKSILKTLIDYPIDENGVLLEWADERTPIDPSHRHLSHLYGIFPSNLFEGDKSLTEAAEKAILKRTEHGLFNSASWSFAWYSCLYARLGNSANTMEFIEHIIKSALLPNLLTVHNDWRSGTPYSHMVNHKVFQIDALLGYGAAVCELLVGEKDGMVFLLPSLPDEWKKEGSVKGIHISGNTELNFTWSNGIITELRAVSANGSRNIRVVMPDGKINEITAQPADSSSL